MKRNLDYGSIPEHPLALLRWLPAGYRRRILTTVFLLVLAGLAEGVGILTLLPLLEATNETDGSGGVGLITRFLGFFGAEPTVGPLLLTLVGGVVLKAILFFVATRRAGFVGVDIGRDLRLDLARSLTETRWEFFSSQHVGSLTNSIASEAARATDLFVNLSFSASHAIQGGIYLALAFFTSPIVSLSALVFGSVLVAGLTSFVRMARNAGEHQATILKAMTGRLSDAISSIKPLKAMGRTGFVRKVLEGDIAEMARHERRQTTARTIVPALQEPLIAVVLAVGIFFAVTQRGLPIAELIFLALLFQRTVTRFATAQSFYQTARIMEAPFKLVLGVINEADERNEAAGGTRLATLQQGIRFDEVGFSYGAHPVLRSFSAEIPAGRLTTVVGASGAGKTTLLDLLCGLLEPSEGAVCVDGVDLRELDLQAWRQRIGYVPQEMTLLHDSVLENIRLGDERISEETIRESIRAAGAEQFIMNLSDGLYSVIGERGTSLSGGQRQRLALARALALNPDLLILDEVTTALDPVTEAEICDTLLSLRGTCTIVAISHQSALVRAAEHLIEVSQLETTG